MKSSIKSGEIGFKIAQYCKKYRDPFTEGNLEMYNTNIKNWSPFGHIIPLLEIYPKKTDMQRDSKKLPKFLFIKQNSGHSPKSPQNYIC